MMKQSVKERRANTADFICNVVASRPFLLLSDKNGVSLGWSPIPQEGRMEVAGVWLSDV